MAIHRLEDKISPALGRIGRPVYIENPAEESMKHDLRWVVFAPADDDPTCVGLDYVADVDLDPNAVPADRYAVDGSPL